MADLVGTVEIPKLNRFNSLSAIIKLSGLAITKVANCGNCYFIIDLFGRPTELAYVKLNLYRTVWSTFL